MTRQEIITQEQTTGHLCLMLQGMFMRAYNGSAQTLAKLTGYKLKRLPGSSNDKPVCYCGFPVARLPHVCDRILEAGGVVVCRNDTYAEFEGLEVTFDPVAAQSLPASETGRKETNTAPKITDELHRRLAAFDLANATPLEAMNFVGELQRACASKPRTDN